MPTLFHVRELSPRLVRITDIAETHFYLVRGDRAAALLDCGVGCGDLRELVASLTGLPLTVLITHGHVDHAMGAGQFDDARISPLDRALYAEHSATEIRLDYIHGGSVSLKNPKTAFVTADMLQPVKPFGDFGPLAPGDRFDLGGVTLEIHEGRGHTPGCVTVLIPEERALLTGDACNPFTYLFDDSCSTVEEYREMLLRLRAATHGRYDRALLCHGPGGEAPAGLIDSVVAVCDDILSGRVDNQPFRGFHGERVYIAKAMDRRSFTRADGGIGNVVYHPGRIRGEN